MYKAQFLYRDTDTWLDSSDIKDGLTVSSVWDQILQSDAAGRLTYRVVPVSETPKETEMAPENRISPFYYTRLDPQPRDVSRAWGLNYAKATAIKYISRAGHKPGSSELVDLEKAISFLQWEVDYIKRCEETKAGKEK